jgi:hypothetical protein
VIVNIENIYVKKLFFNKKGGFIYYFREDYDDANFVELDSNDMLRKIYEEEQLELFNTAKLLYDEYNEVIKIVASNNNFIAKYYPSIFQENSCVFIYWKDYSNRNKLTYLDYKKRKKVKGDYIKINKRLGYTEKSFKEAFKSELDVIMKFESMFKVIRKKSELLKKLDYYRNLAFKYNDDEINEVLEYIDSKAEE